MTLLLSAALTLLAGSETRREILRTGSRGARMRRRAHGQWHDFALEGGTGLKAGPWFPYLMLNEEDRLSDHCVHRPKPTKSAGKTSKAPAAASSADAVSADGAGAGAAVGKDEESASPPQNKARHDEGGGSK